ncbi:MULTISPECIES: penicillin-binding transpeptidase domain-containing protein [Bacillales]|uniref:penicillin-binding transpeptidase domain-containing protein n=1 Tax=Bacillales TaxID=1385 RepID=UPI00034ACBB7|nr:MULTISPECIES: penicillin-binding transpeptidase domain-containing protein [Bacillales]KMZ44589.1 penicillin-binding protein [Bacillus sp. FJAT-27238]
MKKTWIVFWTVFVVVLSGFFYLFWDFWKDTTQSDGERAKAAFTAYTTKWKEQKFSDMYEQLSLHTKKTISKEEFVSRYQNIYGGVEAKAIVVEPMYNGDVMPGEDGQINFHYRLTMETFVEPISFTGKATLVKETQNDLEDWYIHWNPTFIFPEMKEGDKVRANTVYPRRGEITDRAGRPLATERVVIDIGINPGEWSQTSQTGKMAVSKLLQIPLEDLTSKVQATTSKSTKFIRIATLPQDDARIKQLEKTEGLQLQKKKVRFYPYQDATAHLVGYVGAINQEEYEKRKDQGYKTSDVIGKSGLEQIFEEKLRGSAGGRIVITDADGTEKKTVVERLPKHGQPLALTIDAEVQQTIYQELKNEAGTAAAISPKTGEILALVNSPSFDPNAFVLGMSATEWKQLNENPQKPLLNRFARGFAPGSTFKPITAAIGLVSGAITPADSIHVRGLHWQKDVSWGGYEVTRVSDYGGPVDLEKALVYSDNIYFAKAALSIGEEPFVKKSELFGFHEALPIPYPLEKSKLYNDGFKNEIQLADSGYGQGEVTMTPLHLALVYSAFANDGNIVNPSLLQGDKKEGYWKTNVIPADVASTVKQHLIQVMEDPRGTGRGARVPGIRMAGKTGIAELKQKKGELGLENGWYAVFNVDDPRLLVTMMIEDVRGRGGSHVLDARIKRIFTKALKN